MTRKVLYSPGFGAGWTTWHHGSKEQKLFMLEFPALIDAVERGESTREGSPAGDKFVAEFTARWGFAALPYLGGMSKLKVAVVSGRVRINEYDGGESVEEENGYEGWL